MHCDRSTQVLRGRSRGEGTNLAQGGVARDWCWCKGVKDWWETASKKTGREEVPYQGPEVWERYNPQDWGKFVWRGARGEAGAIPKHLRQVGAVQSILVVLTYLNITAALRENQRFLGIYWGSDTVLTALCAITDLIPTATVRLVLWSFPFYRKEVRHGEDKKKCPMSC